LPKSGFSVVCADAPASITNNAIKIADTIVQNLCIVALRNIRLKEVHFRGTRYCPTFGLDPQSAFPDNLNSGTRRNQVVAADY
jgi:hypothetical protein